MFIVSKRNYLVIRADGSAYRIKKDYIGEIPEDVAESVLVQRAIQGRQILPFLGEQKTGRFIRQMKRQRNLRQNMTSVRMPKSWRWIRKLKQRTQKNPPGIKRESDDDVAVWKYEPDGAEV